MRPGTRFSHSMTLGAIALAAALVVGTYAFAILRAQALEIPTHIKVSICGNGTIEDEVCDDGTADNDGVYASSTELRRCQASCQAFGPYCGDGVLQVRFGEECDDGNNVNGDLCSMSCREEIPVHPRSTGAPPRGPIEPLPALPGQIPGELITKVILRGKAYPNSTVNILLDGKSFANVQADSNADFLFTSTDITPGTAVFSFNAIDRFGTASLTQTTIFDVVQSAITTVANIFLPPTITVKPDKVAPGGLVLLSGQTVPKAHINTEIHSATSTLEADAESNGDWALQLDTGAMSNGYHTAKASFKLSDTIKSGFGKSVSFYVGTAPPAGSCAKPDMNGDGKVNLVDFSIFLLSWNKTDAQADFNCDGNVNLADFSIMLFQWTG